jgi:hypothetical protein
MSARPLLLDFQSRPRRDGRLGAAILALGAAGTIFAGLQFYESGLKRDGLELRLEALESARNARLGAVSAVPAEASAPVVNDLGAPWSLLLAELETASHDNASSVAVLGVEPDREKGRIRIVAEARDLQTALAYIQRLQKSRALRYPMLDSHEIRTEDKDQPVRFQLSADWNTGT